MQQSFLPVKNGRKEKINVTVEKAADAKPVNSGTGV
jgi:hypothetical protein